jgi:HD-like signal output (HDOD) protein
MPFLTEPLRDLGAWTRWLLQQELPVLESTSAAIEALRDFQDEVTPATLEDIVSRDPLMTTKFLAHVAGRRRHLEVTTPESVLSALILYGVGPFFRDFGPQPVLEGRLQERPEALEAVQSLLHRGDRAARFALAFAVHRADPDAGVIRQAAFLKDVVELLLWFHAPDLMLKIRHAQVANPTLRSVQAQRAYLHVVLEELRQALLEAWHIPDLQTRGIELAGRLARHTMNGWDNPGLPDDIHEIAELLNAAPRVALAYVRKVDQD